MPLLIYVFDSENNLQLCVIKRNSELKCIDGNVSDVSPQNINNKMILTARKLDMYYFFKEITFWDKFREHIATELKNNILIINVLDPEDNAIDYKWSKIASATVWQRVETENLLSWLSTLGGGFSALGENFINCAEIAAKISLRQLAIGCRLGDPFLQARCKLFYGLSLIQTGRLKLAKKIIKEQYKFANSHNSVDSRLIKMCEGIWLKLQYSYFTKPKIGTRLRS